MLDRTFNYIDIVLLFLLL